MLSDRAQSLLKILVERYIAEGQPVGSRALSRFSSLELSPATIRNVMADLEEMGFVASPHTSAGRVPTPKGYRFFVDTLLTVRPLEEVERRHIERVLLEEGGHVERAARRLGVPLGQPPRQQDLPNGAGRVSDTPCPAMYGLLATRLCRRAASPASNSFTTRISSPSCLPMWRRKLLEPKSTAAYIPASFSNVIMTAPALKIVPQ